MRRTLLAALLWAAAARADVLPSSPKTPATSAERVPFKAGQGGASVRGSKHDLSVTGPGPIKSETETQVCVFCHIPHRAATGAKHLSSRPEIGETHVPYGSSTARLRASAPTGSSRVCLSCHDGTIAVGETVRRKIDVSGGAAGRIPSGRRSNLGTDLRRTHPVSVSAKAVRKFREKSGRVDENGLVQCTSCHDPHSQFGGTPEGKFLLETTRNGRLCGSCHAPSASSHATSDRPFGAAQGNEAGYASVGEAGCAACHRSHDADPAGRLVARAEGEEEDAICLACHSGGVARANVGRDLSKPSAHAVRIRQGRHDAAEGPDRPVRLPETSSAALRHVACVDCHDPHEASARPALAPNVPGTLAGVWGIDLAGRRVEAATREYEVCLKCHGDSANKPTGPGTLGRARRAADDDNLRRVFDPNAASAHPVAAPGRSADVPSLKPPLGPASQIYCADCHASDDGPGAGGSGARGPHGSIYPSLLERNYTTGDRAVESPAAYALCYKCHDREILLSDRSAFPLHRKHVVDRQATCSVCHVAHGVSSLRGTALGNAHLIDFDLGAVRPAPGGLPPYRSNGARTGSCSLTCHGKPHEAAAY